jgi:hypothetical protein
MAHKVTEQEFLRDVEAHKMTVIKDDGVHRHIRFKDPETICMHFDLITWPGYLCYTGDMGTYVFSRLRDMFEFFRTDRDSTWLKENGLTLGINPSYWGEKLEANDKHAGFKKFSDEKFEAAIKNYFVQWMRDNRYRTTKEERRELWESIEGDVLGADGDSGGYRKQCAANDFYHEVNSAVGNFYFQDFWETNVEEYSSRFAWCCYALAWGIQQYDDAKAPVMEGAPA